jgi:AcrR family transcriptional regulator
MQTGTRTERGDRSRARILEAATRVFAEDGYAGASMARILDTAGATKGGFYFHFASKQELALAVMGAQLDQWFAETMAAASRHERAVDQLFAVPRVLTEQIRSGRGLASFQRLLADLCADEQLRDQVESGIRPWVDATAQQFQRAMDEGDLRPDLDPRAMAELVIGAFNGILTLTEQLGDGRLERRVDSLVEMVRSYTAADRKGRR